MLALDVARCEGRRMVVEAHTTIAAECETCQRRTDRPPHVERLWFMEPPTSLYCFSKVYPDDDSEDGSGVD